MIQALIIDDEMKSQSTLHKLLEKYCSDVEVIGFAHNVQSGILAINKLKPELVFLDISMPDGDGFEILKRVTERNFEVIFTTAYNDYAIKAFQFAALHYLLKPINYLELQNAVYRYQNNRSAIDMKEKIQILYDSMNNHHQKIILPTANGLRVIELKQIIYCQADGSYTKFFLTEGESILVSKGLSNFEDILPSDIFCRVHSKHLVNMNFVSKYVKGRAGKIVLLNGSEIDVSESKKSEFLKHIKKLAHFLPDLKK